MTASGTQSDRQEGRSGCRGALTDQTGVREAHWKVTFVAKLEGGEGFSPVALWGGGPFQQQGQPPQRPKSGVSLTRSESLREDKVGVVGDGVGRMAGRRGREHGGETGPRG